jgi:phage/plasmid-like protein (TIGR03299 family)
MAHNIHFNEQTKKHSFFSVNQKAWHGLGQIVQEYTTSSAALEYAGLDFRVEKRKLFTYDNVNNFGNSDNLFPSVKVPGYFATVRTDTETVLGVVGKEYEVVQNRDAFSFFDSIVGGEGGIQYETAGALGKGERIFITAKLPSYIRVGKDDLIDQYLFLTTSHDGYGSITAAFTPVRIVCNNTLNAALKNCTGTVKIRHTANAKERLEQAHKLMGISSELSIQLEAIFNHWKRVPVSDTGVKKLIQLAMAPSKETYEKLHKGGESAFSTHFTNTVNSIFEYAMTNPTQQLETTKGTVFGAFNAVTGYFQNVRNYKNEEAKFKSILLGGTAQQRVQSAFNLCSAFAKKGWSALGLN